MTLLRYMTTAAALVGTTSAAVIMVDVGLNGGLTFSPNNPTANTGDQVQFAFLSGNHSVVWGDFANPCQPAKTTPFFSGFITGSNPASQVFTVNITTTDPIPFYCAQPTFTHCQNGMVGVINPSSTITADAFAAAAKNAQGVGAPVSVQGGVVGSPANAPSSSTSAAAPSKTSGSSSSNSGGLYGSGGSSGSGSSASGAAGTAAASWTRLLLAAGLPLFMG